MIHYTIQQIAEVVKGSFISNGNSSAIIKHLLIDSRKLGSTDDSLFFAIKGERNDGHSFIPDLYQKGIRHFIVSEKIDRVDQYPGASIILVSDTLKALQEISAFHRSQFHIPVVGITGSNGKTIIKEWIYQLLREDKNIVRSPKSFNSQVGVPLSVWQMNEGHAIGVFEAGISKPNEMELLEKIIKPTIGIFTNLGNAHDENFSNSSFKTNEKLKLFSNVELLIYCKDYGIINEAIEKSNIYNETTLFTWSKKSKANLQIAKVAKREHETEIQGIYKNKFITIVIPFTDEASIENSIHCWSLLLHLNYENDIIAHRMKYLSPVAMRLELKEGVNNCSVINDSYNSDLGSLAIAIDFLNQQKQHPTQTLILSDILQSGKNEELLYKEVAELVSKKGVQKIIGIGEGLMRQQDLFQTKEKQFFKSTADFLAAYNYSFFHNETILIKGARAFGFEEIGKVLQQKAHETVLEINLNALIHNLNYYRSKLRSDTKIMAMVKAFSYGSGSFEIANVLQFHRVDYLAVAYADEGVELRKAGITLPIMVMNPEEQSYDAMIQYQLEPEIFSFRILTLFDEAAKRVGNKSEKQKPLDIHLKMDTGMRRLGFEEKDLNELIVRLKNNRDLNIKTIFSHLAASDEKEHDEYTRLQIKRFTEMSDKISTHFPHRIYRHILNSAGIARFPDAQFDMVRLGIGLYGIGSSPLEQKQLQNVSALKTTISQIKHVPANETIGYSRKGRANQDMRIATIPIGYADGLSRKLSNGIGKVLIKGQLASIVGNVCMDMCMIDITNIIVKEGDEVIIFNDARPITELAKDLGTIPYEALTSVSRRVKRVYYQE